MSERIVVYGFGSFFANKPVSNDIDLLLMHENIGVASCMFAIQCKQAFMEQLIKGHITILSHDEEVGLDFVTKAKALRIGAIRQDHLDQDVATMVRRLTA